MEHEAKKSGELGAWKGTPSQVSDLFAAAWAAYREELDPSAAKDGYRITVNTGDSAVRYENLGEFEEAGVDELQAATSIRFWASSSIPDTSCSINLQRDGVTNGASYTVSGPLRVKVIGTAGELERILAPGRRFGRFGFVAGMIAFCVIITVEMVSGALVILTDGGIPASNVWLFANLGLLAIVVLYGALTAILIPWVEILDPQKPETRLRRFLNSNWTITIGSALIAGLLLGLVV